MDMPFAFEKLGGLNRDRLLALVDPVVAAHGLEGVELIWNTDQRGWKLVVTLERPGATQSGAGVTLDDCTEVSRDLSAALDASDVVPGAYRLEVGTPGVERKLYSLSDYRRFKGQRAKIKCSEPILGQWTLIGELLGVDEQQRVQLRTEGALTESGVLTLEYSKIQSGQLVLDMSVRGPGHRAANGANRQRRAAKQDR
jgi:ribosome maturation factor RimP